MSTLQSQDLKLHEINLNENDSKMSKHSTLQVKDLKEMTKQILSAKANDQNIKQQLDYIKKRINFKAQNQSDQSYDGDQSFRNSIKCNFLDESESNYSSVSTVASISIEKNDIPPQTKQKGEQIIIASNAGVNGTKIKQGTTSSFIELWNQFKQIYMEEKIVSNISEKEKQQPIKQQKDSEEEENNGYGYNIFSCFQCFKKRNLPKNIKIEKNTIIYMYNTKRIQKGNNSSLLQKINRFYTLVDTRTNTVLYNNYQIDNLNILSNLLMIAFSEFHSEIFYHLLEIYENAPVVGDKQKISIINVSCTFTNEIIYLLSTQRLDNQIMKSSSVINYVNNLYFALMFCYFQECVRNNNDFGEEFSKQIIAALLKQANLKPDSIISYFTKRFPSFIIDKNFLKYI